jgi:hypothetical protein
MKNKFSLLSGKFTPDYVILWIQEKKSFNIKAISISDLSSV